MSKKKTKVESIPTRAKILQEGVTLTTSDRNKTYGEATVNMQHMAGMLTAYFKNLIQSTSGEIFYFTGEDAAQIMAIAKLSRTAHRGVPFHKDNYTDQAVYSAMAGECAEVER